MIADQTHRLAQTGSPETERSQTLPRLARLGPEHERGADVTNANGNPPNGIELRRNTRKPNRARAQRAEVKAAGVVACSELFGGATPVWPLCSGTARPLQR